MIPTLIKQILLNNISDQSFTLLCRSFSTGINRIEILVGEVYELDTPNLIPLPKVNNTSINNNFLLGFIPYKHIKEHNFDYIDDVKLIVMKVTHCEVISTTEVLRILPSLSIKLSEGIFDISDDLYAAIAKKIIEEIGCGEGSNFVIKCQITADITDYSIESDLSVFHGLIKNEMSTYWTFLIHMEFWVSDPKNNFWGAVMLWELEQVMLQALRLNRAVELIGYLPITRFMFDVEPSVEGTHYETG